VSASLDVLYAGAVKLFGREFEPDERVGDPPPVCPWNFEDILGRGEDWQPDGDDTSSPAP